VKKLLALVLAPVLIVGTVVSLMMFGSTTPSSRNVCVAAGYAGVLTAGGDGWTIPIGSAYTVTAEYGWRIHPTRGTRDLHTGIDLSTGGGAAVLAASSGTVSGVVNLGTRSYGLYVTIDHGAGVQTRYAHLASTNVRIGQTVGTGQQIGVEGASGDVTGPHLHFEMILQGAPVEPRAAMADRGLTFDGRPGTAVASGTTDAQLPAAAQGVDQSSSLSASQLAVAAQIVKAGMDAGLPPRAWLVALVTAMQESALGADPASQVPNRDGDVGVFQQRALLGWYADGATVAENVAILKDPYYAAMTFYEGHDVAATVTGGAGAAGYHIPGLVDITGWESVPVWVAAAAVQRPAEQYRQAYAKWEATARAIMMHLGQASADASQLAACPGSNGTVVGEGAGAQAAAAALAQVGIPYSWGAGSLTGPSTGICCSPGGHDGRIVVGFDCSGLTRYAWAQVGVILPRTDLEQRAVTTDVPRDQIRAGDLLFFPGHVGIADGRGGMVHAPRTGVPVEVTPNILTDSYYGPRLIKVGRPTTH